MGKTGVGEQREGGGGACRQGRRRIDSAQALFVVAGVGVGRVEFEDLRAGAAGAGVVISEDASSEACLEFLDACEESIGIDLAGAVLAAGAGVSENLGCALDPSLDLFEALAFVVGEWQSGDLLNEFEDVAVRVADVCSVGVPIEAENVEEIFGLGAVVK